MDAQRTPPAIHISQNRWTQGQHDDCGQNDFLRTCEWFEKKKALMMRRFKSSHCGRMKKKNG